MWQSLPRHDVESRPIGANARRAHPPRVRARTNNYHETKRREILQNIQEDAQTAAVTSPQPQMPGVRLFNNFVKGNTYYKSTREFDKNRKLSLFEIGVGKGGALHQWLRHGITEVYGVDINILSLQECHNRYLETVGTNPNRLRLFLDQVQPSDPSDIRLVGHDRIPDNPFGQFDLIACQFALHYFCESRETLLQLLQCVKRRLAHDGIFFGTIMDGDAVLRFMGPHQAVDNGVIAIVKQEPNILHVRLHDSDYFRNGYISEFRVTRNLLEEMCEEAGLKVTRWASFLSYEKAYKNYTKRNVSFRQEEREFLMMHATFEIRAM